MLHLLNKPIIEYSLDCCIAVNISEIIIAVGYKAEEIINTYGNSYKGKSLRYVIQHEQKGLVHAIETAKQAIGHADFLLLLGDEVLANPKHPLMIEQFKKEDLFGVCGVFLEKRKERIGKTYTIMQDEHNRIYRLIEKPRKPMNDWMGTGNCVFKNELLSYIERTPINQNRGEKELPDLIQCAIDEGHIVKSFVICDHYSNVNCENDLQEAQRLLQLFNNHCQKV